MPSWPDRLTPLRERDFLLLFLGRTVSLFGTALAPIALAFGVLDVGGSASDLGLVVGAQVVPMILFLLVGGIWADRLPRHHVMVAADLVGGAAQAVVAVLFLTGNAEIWALVVLSAIRGAAGAFFLPAAQGIVPQVVTPGRLQEANALLRLSRNGTQIGGTALAGVLVAVAGPGWALALDAVTYFLGAVFLGALRLPSSERMAERHFIRELREGWDEFRSRTWLWAIVLQFSFLAAASIGAWHVLGPFVADRSLGGAPAFVSGVGIELFSVMWDLTMQQQIPPEALSRVSSYDALGSFIFIPLGAVLAGPIADAIGVGPALVGAGLGVIATTAAVLLVDDVRTLRRRTVTPTP